jgi:hypothetical protein
MQAKGAVQLLPEALCAGVLYPLWKLPDNISKPSRDFFVSSWNNMVTICCGFVRGTQFRTFCPFVATIALVAGGLLSASQAAAQSSIPPPVTILQNTGPLANGFIFIGAEPSGGPNSVQGPEVLDGQGRIVWFSPLPDGQVATDVRVQTYNNNPVLTYVRTPAYNAVSQSPTIDYILDKTYSVVATVVAGNGYGADQHEFLLTPANTALITVNNVVTADLSALGGPTNGSVEEGVVQEINVATGAVVFEWHSLTYVPLGDSYYAYTPGQIKAYDYFHINSVKLDTDGNILISSRHTWTVYKVNRTTGALIWRLGGKKSDYALGTGLPFAWQHDVEAVDSQTLRIFDNESDGVPVLPYSRVIWVNHNDTAMTASVAQSLVHPDNLSVLAEGNAQALDNGDTFVEWGILGRYSEFSPAGQLLYDVSEATGYSSYRGYRYAWTGAPIADPTAAPLQNGDGTLSVHAVWNGATQVASWEVLGGDTSGALGVVGTAQWNGFDTSITIPGPLNNIQIVALDSTGAAIGTSATVSGPFAAVFPTQPVSQTIAAGGTVVFDAVANGSAPTYQWMFNGSPLQPDSTNLARITGTSGPTLVISGATAADAGVYSCVATILGNSATSNSATLALGSTADAGRLVDISCRSSVETGGGVLIIGFALGGQGTSGSEPLLIRASGPALTQFGVSGVLPDPELQLYGSDGVLATNVGWAGNSQIASTAAMVGAFPWNSGASLDSAIDDSLTAGPFSAVISGASGDTGVLLGEVYDATPASARLPTTPHLINLSGRSHVGTGANILIAGFVIAGTTSETVLIRASGPALAQFGVSGALADPLLQLYQSGSDGTSTLLGKNSGWSGDPQIAAAADSAGAFSWGTSASADSALLVTLPPGAYTVEISGASGDTGVALVEVYEVE